MATIEQLQALEKRLSNARPEVGDEFRDALTEAMDSLLLVDADVSERFDASRPTVNRWRNGKSAPVIAVRKLVLQFLLKRTQRLIKAESPKTKAAPPPRIVPGAPRQDSAEEGEDSRSRRRASPSLGEKVTITSDDRR